MKLATLHCHQKQVVRPIAGKDSFTYTELLFKSMNILNFNKTNIFNFLLHTKMQVKPCATYRIVCI